MKPKIERYTEKFINTNYDKKDRKKGNSVKFEWFVNSMHCWKYSSQSYNSKSKIGQEISLGKAQGSDAFFLLTNNKIFTLNDDIKTVKKTILDSDNKIEFHLIQSKKSSKADLGDFKKFAEIPIKIIKKIGIGEEQKELNKLKYFINEIIQDNDELEVSFNLSFYTKKNENDIKSLKNDWKHELEFTENQYEDYGNVNIELLGSKHLNDLYEQFNSNEYKLFINKDNVMLDNNSFLIGCLTAKELLDAIAPLKKRKRILYPDVFKNNLRLYLGETPVNKNIEKTLIEEPRKFHLYNNGLTITTKEIEPKINKYSISPVNIVNGCQTANSVYNILKDGSGNESEVKIPVKIIIANDEEYEKITIRTNSQNGISEKDLISIKNIQKDLEEDFRETVFQNKKFFYKRQNSEDKKYNEADFVITINDILRANFSSLFLMPHKVLGYFDITTNKYIDILFEERFIRLYKVVTILLKIIDEYIEENHIELYRLKYHILYLFYKYINEEDDITKIETYFVKQKSKYIFEGNIEIKNKLEQNSNNIIAKLYEYGNKKEIFIRIIEYIVITLKENYPQLLNLDTKIKERILYKTVDERQRGEKVFKDFKTIFNTNIGDL